MKKTINYAELLKRIHTKRLELETISKKLKTKFVGIDGIIDSIINNINVWYIMPELINRPVIINLWGMTGVGKTDLVRTLVKELQFSDRFLEIQLSNKGESSSYHHDSIQQCLNSSSIDYDEAGIVLLDEMQRFRTIDGQGLEIMDCKFQDLWMLLSDGCFSNNGNSKASLLELLFGDAYWTQYYDDDKDDDSNKSTESPQPKKKKRKYQRSYYSAGQIKKKLRLVESVEEIMMWSEEKKASLICEALKDNKTHDGDSYSKLLIFISGNLDEAYDMADQTGNADYDADVFHEFSSKINIVDIKTALKKRFKPEQISRFGNVHIIYPSLSKHSYQTIIKRKVEEIIKNIKEQHNVTIDIDQSVHDCIYRNGVFPTQGVRPVFSSIYALLGTSIPTFILRAIENKKDKIKLSYKQDKLVATINGKEHYYNIECSIDKIKEENEHDEKVCTSVHEAGHAVVYAVLFGVAPTQITSLTSSSDNSGFIGLHTIVNSKLDLQNKIITFYGGKVAEEIVFGEDYATSGSCGDIEKATRLTSSFFRDYGMGTFSSKVCNQYSDHSPPGNYEMDKTNDPIEKFISECKVKTKEIISEHMEFFTFTVDELIREGEIKPAKFQSIAKKFGLAIEVVAPKKQILSKYGEQFEVFKQKGLVQPSQKAIGRNINNTELKVAAKEKRSKR